MIDLLFFNLMRVPVFSLLFQKLSPSVIYLLIFHRVELWKIQTVEKYKHIETLSYNDLHKISPSVIELFIFQKMGIGKCEYI